MKVIEVQNMRKYYQKHVGTEDVSFSVEEGELFGFVGPNGAGKSTTIKVLLGFIFADSGSASICGKDVVGETKEIKRFTGYVPSDVRFYRSLKISELLERNGRFYGLEQYKAEVDRLCALFELDTTKRFSELSTGNKKKAAIVCALASGPKVLILDEPTNGLDPMIQKKLFTELQNQKANGTTILLSSHNLAEVQEYCDRVAFIKAGKILAVTDLKGVQPQKIVTVFGGKQSLLDDLDILEQNSEKCVFRHCGDISALLKLLGSVKPDDFTVENESIEEQFMLMYKEGDVK